MKKLYERGDIYDLLESPAKDNVTRRHYETLFKGKAIHTFLDVSIGTGSMTLPLADLGIALYGSDLSTAMLRKCQEKCDVRGIPITLKQSDFRSVADSFHESFDCVASTGNSLGYVSNEDVLHTLEQMDILVKDGGYLYFDLRNWDMILQSKPRYYLYNPSFVDDIRVNLVQFWDYLSDQTLDFNLLFTFEKNSKIIQTEHFVEHYTPIRRQKLIDKLTELGYHSIETRRLPTQFGSFDPAVTDWYCVIARKGA